MKITTISFHSRASICVKGSYYTFEYGEDRQLDEGDDRDIEITKLTEDCNKVVDDQISEIYDFLHKKK